KSYLTRLNADGSLDGGFGSGADGFVETLALQSDGRIVMGGSFTSVGGKSRNHIARLNADGSLDPGFNPGSGANDTVHALGIAPDGKIIIGGSFTTMDGQARNHFTRLNADGTVDATFAIGSGANARVNVVVPQ